MDYEKLLIDAHSKSTKDQIVAHIGDDPQRLADFMNTYMGDNPVVVQRAAWCIRDLGKGIPQLMEPYWTDMIAMMKQDHHDAVQRNTLALLAEIKIEEKYWDDLYEYCFNLLQNPQKPAAIRVHAMTVLFQIANQIPELKPELAMVIEEHLPMGSSGFKNRGGKLLKKLRA
ncbi:MAG: hypothetical protein AAFY71_20015 [Bacteroidota bacterium]